MCDKYFTVNIRAYLDKDELTYIGEENLHDLLSDFSCPRNPDVEHFLLYNAIKPISVCTEKISKTMVKKLARVSILDEETASYMTAAYLTK